MTNPESFERLVEIFEHARDISLQDRSEYLSRICDGQPELHNQVRALLEQHDREGLLDNPIPMTALSEEPMPLRIGGYRIIEAIGRGGMGVVYRAEQDHPRRQVAVKVVHAGLLTPEMRRRFEFESSVLARLMHPGIAVFFEVGTWDDGHGARPFFAMELVDGLTLDQYLEQEKPSIDSRLRLFIAICDAVHHAHQKGVIHRDLKPQNILVCADGTPKILDFGVARTTDIDVFATQQTQSGQLLGTLAYMSPEQINSTTEDVDTRSDVYALGVILYELLAGRLPYNLSRTSITGVARIIEETQPPSLSSIHKELRGDLNTITHKALCKTPGNRYQSVSDLSADLHRFLKHEPISARPATAAYHARRFTRRHRGLVAGMICVVFAVILGSVGFVWQAARVNAEAQTRREIGAFLSEMLTSVDPAKTAGEPLTVRDMLDDAAANLHERFDSAPEVRGELHTMVGQTYYSLGEYAAAEYHLRMAIDDLSGEKESRTDRWFLAMTSLGLALYQQDRLEEAESILLDAQDSLRSSDRVEANRVNMNLAMVLDALGRSVEAEALYRESYIRNLAKNGPDAKDTLLAQNNLGTLLMQQDRFDEALPLLEDCLRRRRITRGDDHPLTISTLANLAALYSNLGRDEETMPMLLEAAERSERVLGPVHLNTLHCRHNIVVLSLRKGDFAQATIQAQALLETIDAELDPWHPERLGAIEITVTALALGGDSEAGEALALESYRLVESNRGPKHRSTGRAAMLLFNLYDETGDTEQMDLWRARIEASDFSP